MKRTATSTKKLLAAAALLAGDKQATAAKKAGVSRTTIWRWQQDDEEFKAILLQGEQDIMDLTTDNMALGALEAIETLREEMKSKVPRTRIAAAKGLLTNYLRIMLKGEITQQIRELQEQEGENGEFDDA